MGCEATSRPDVEPRCARGAFGSRRGEDPEGLLHGIGGSRCGCSGGTWAGRIPSPFSSSGLMRAAHRKGSASIHPASQNSSRLRKDPLPLHCNPGRRSASRTVASGLRFPSSLYVLFLRRRRALSTGKFSDVDAEKACAIAAEHTVFSDGMHLAAKAPTVQTSCK